MQQVVENTNRLLGTKRTLEFFTKGYRYLIQVRVGGRVRVRARVRVGWAKGYCRYLIQILPVVVVAPLYFAWDPHL
jgi:hypothetical protein